MPIANESGNIALVYYMSIPQHVIANRHNYIFTARHSVCLAWVIPEDVEVILSITKKCGCSGKNAPRKVYKYANDMQVRIWSGISDR